MAEAFALAMNLLKSTRSGSLREKHGRKNNVNIL